MPARAQGTHEQAALALAEALEAAAAAVDAWALALERQGGSALLGDVASNTLLGRNRNRSDELQAEVEELRRSATAHRRASRELAVRAPNVSWSLEEVQQLAEQALEGAAQARVGKLDADDWAADTRRSSQKQYRQAAGAAHEKAAELYDRAYGLFTQIADAQGALSSQRQLSAEAYELVAQAQESLADAEEAWSRAEEATAGAEGMWTRALEGDKSSQAMERSAQARERAGEARRRTMQWRERAAKAREGTLEGEEDLDSELRERAAQARQEVLASRGNAAVVLDSDRNNSALFRVTAAAWEDAARAWSTAAAAMERAADAWDLAARAKG